jgi:hypothetical protein
MIADDDVYAIGLVVEPTASDAEVCHHGGDW